MREIMSLCVYSQSYIFCLSMFFFTTTKDHRVLRSAAKGCFKEKKKNLTCVEDGCWLKIGSHFSHFSLGNLLTSSFHIPISGKGLKVGLRESVSAS